MTKLDQPPKREPRAAIEHRLQASPIASAWCASIWWRVCPDLLGLVDKRGYFVRCNPAWKTLLGWLPEDICALPFTEFVHPDDLDKTQEAWARVQAGEVVIDFENRYLCQDGHHKALHWLAAIDEDFVFCQARDIAVEVARWGAHPLAGAKGQD